MVAASHGLMMMKKKRKIINFFSRGESPFKESVCEPFEGQVF